MTSFANILFVAERSDNDSAALHQAMDLADNNQAQLTIVGLAEVSERQKAAVDATTKQLLAAIVDERQEELESLVRDTSGSCVPVDTRVLVGRGVLEVIRAVLRHQYDLVIKSGETNYGFASTFSGADLKLLRKCPCPVWVIKSTQQQGDREILAALDYDPDDPGIDALNCQILEVSTSLALADFAEVHVVHAWRLPHESFLRSPRSSFSNADVDRMIQDEKTRRRTWLESLVNRVCGAKGEKVVAYIGPQIHFIEGGASQLVPRLAEKLGAELVVMGTIGRTGIPGFLIGNTAENILQRISCSALTIHPAGFVSPVTLEG